MIVALAFDNKVCVLSNVDNVMHAVLDYQLLTLQGPRDLNNVSAIYFQRKCILIQCSREQIETIFGQFKHI